MKTLEIEKVWTGDGYGQVDAITLRQIKRTAIAAIYQRFATNGNSQGFEVFTIKVVEAGTPLPGGVVVPETYEQYPTANRFGKTAWHVSSLEKAEAIYVRLNTDAGHDGKVFVKFNIPSGEFTAGELADFNDVEYITASNYIKAALANNTVQYIREERRNARGKASKIYASIN